MNIKSDEEIKKQLKEEFWPEKHWLVCNCDLEGGECSAEVLNKLLEKFILSVRHSDILALREMIEEDYINYVIAKSYGNPYGGKTPFAEWAKKAEAKDMGTWD